MRIRQLLPLLLLAAASACGPQPLVTIARDVEVTAYAPTAGTWTIEFDVRNEGSRTVYVAACDGHIIPAVQPRDVWDDDDSEVFSVRCIGGAATPVAVAPGQTVRAAGNAASGPGEYRIGVVVLDSPTARDQKVAFSRGVIVQ